MRNSDDTAQAKTIETGPQVRSAFLRQSKDHCTWPNDFMPELSHDEPEVAELAERLWRLAKPRLEASDESLNRLTFKQILDQTGSDLFSHADVGIKALAAAKHLMSAAFAQIETACDVVATE